MDGIRTDMCRKAMISYEGAKRRLLIGGITQSSDQISPFTRLALEI